VYEEIKPTPRQLEILQLIAYGYTYRKIALKLGISHQTIKNHLSDMRDRIKVDSTHQAVAIGIRKGWII